MDHRRIIGLLIIAGLAACGGDHAAVDAFTADRWVIPAAFTISGIASARSTIGSVPVVGVMVTAYPSSSSTTVLATATTDAVGGFTLTIETHGSVVDLRLAATAPGYVDTYLYFPNPYFAESRSGVSLDMLTPGAYALVYSSTGVTHTAGTAMLEVVAKDGYGPLPLTTFSSMPSGTVRYTLNDLPSPDAPYTASDGLGYVLGVVPGSVALYATSPSAYFNGPATVQGFADSLTMTMAEVQPPQGGD